LWKFIIFAAKYLVMSEKGSNFASVFKNKPKLLNENQSIYRLKERKNYEERS